MITISRSANYNEQFVFREVGIETSGLVLGRLIALCINVGLRCLIAFEDFEGYAR